MTDTNALWYAELVAQNDGFVPTIKAPGSLRRDEGGPHTGYWRIMGALTKWDTPVCVWRADDEESIILQVGRNRPINSFASPRDYEDFMEMAFLKCAAARRAEYDIALETGRWPNGRLSRDPVQIEDPAALIYALRDDYDVRALLYKKARSALNAGKPLPGMSIIPDVEITK